MTTGNYQLPTSAASRMLARSCAAEAAVGLALIIAIHRQFKTTDLNAVNELKV